MVSNFARCAPCHPELVEGLFIPVKEVSIFEADFS